VRRSGSGFATRETWSDDELAVEEMCCGKGYSLAPTPMIAESVASGVWLPRISLWKVFESAVITCLVGGRSDRSVDSSISVSPGQTPRQSSIRICGGAQPLEPHKNVQRRMSASSRPSLLVKGTEEPRARIFFTEAMAIITAVWEVILYAKFWLVHGIKRVHLYAQEEKETELTS